MLENALRDEPCRSAPLTDEEVVAQVLSGEIGTYELLMRRHNQRLYRMARSIVRNETEAEDIVQEAFVRAYAALTKFEGRSSFATWVTRIAYHEALRARRKQTQESKHKARIGAEIHSNGSAQLEQGRGQEGEGLRRKEIVKMICQSFDKLSTMHRSVLMLRLVEGLSTRETAECLRISESNVKVLLHRAKSQFVGTLEEHSITGLCERFSFAGHRCDRIVRETMGRIDSHDIAS